jgi:F-type H+/Na+-transporting ATPase subunit alpha
LKDAVEEFRRGFETSSGELLVKDEPAEPMEEAEIEREGVARRVPRVEKK